MFKTVIPSKIFEAMGMGLPVLLVAPEGEASAIVRREGVGPVVPGLGSRSSSRSRSRRLARSSGRADHAWRGQVSRRLRATAVSVEARDVLAACRAVLDGTVAANAEPRETRRRVS